MNNEFESLQRQWRNNKQAIESKPLDLESAIANIADKKKSSTKFHYGNIIVLSITVIGLLAFFYFLAPVQEWPSRVGVGLMVGGLITRIIIEWISVSKSKKINMAHKALQATEDTITFYNFRKKIHNPVTITIIILYSIGFYMISPEFSKYFDLWQMVLMDVSYVVIAAVLIIYIRKSVIKEMRMLSEIIEIKKEMQEEHK